VTDQLLLSKSLFFIVLEGAKNCSFVLCQRW